MLPYQYRLDNSVDWIKPKTPIFTNLLAKIKLYELFGIIVTIIYDSQLTI